MGDVRYCEKCGKTLKLTEFYKSNNKEKYPESYLNQCKKCLTMHVDNWDPKTFLWILEECDVPYIPDKWNELLTRYVNEGKTITGTTVLGRYLSVMKLGQYKEWRWKDTEYLQKQADNKIKETMERQGFDMQQINDTIEKGRVAVPDKPAELAASYGGDDFTPYSGPDAYYTKEEIDQLGLTDEDRTYLRLKWGKAYKPEEWVRLEQLYNEMMDSYDIQTAGHIDTLKLLCKTSLKCNQLIDMGDIEGYQKVSKVYDNLMKSGKFQAAQNKAESGEFIDSIGELVALCESEGFIPRFYIDSPNDKVDATLQDMKSYLHNLVTEEMNLGNMIENAVKQMVDEDNREEDEDVEDEIMNMDTLETLKDQDFAEFSDFEDAEAEEDALLDEQEG